MKNYLLILLVVLLVGSLSSLRADDLSGRTGVGIGYSYLSLKHGVNPKLSLEGLINPLYGGIGLGGRAYINITPAEKMVWYLGGGIHLFNYSHRGESGTTIGLSGFGGGEYFVDKNFTVGADLGPVLVSIPGYISGFNIGVHYYFQ